MPEPSLPRWERVREDIGSDISACQRGFLFMGEEEGFCGVGGTTTLSEFDAGMGSVTGLVAG